MARIIDIDENGLTPEQVMDCVTGSGGAMIRRDGHIVAKIEPADDVDLDDDAWAHAAEQVVRGDAARDRYGRGEVVSHDELKRRLGLPKPD